MKYYSKVKEIQVALWVNDDLVDEDSLRMAYKMSTDLIAKSGRDTNEELGRAFFSVGCKIRGMVGKVLGDMSQESLSEVQYYVSNLLLEVAKGEGKEKDLVKSFPWMYQVS